MIADKFAEVSLEYDKLQDGDVEIPKFELSDVPQFSEDDVKAALEGLDVNKSNVVGDVPAKILKLFAKPVMTVINTSIVQGRWPDIFKLEVVTPVPKEYPTKNIDQLRNISGLLNLDKIAEGLVSKLMISDMKKNLDPSQFANQKGLSIQHYLIKMLDRVLEALDKNSKGETCAVIATLVDWKQAFPRQCPKLGVESFIKNGVRPALIPLLVNYFQGRKMKVKWHGEFSTTRELNGGGPQGSTFGIWEYLSQSNENADSIDDDDKFKFVDDLSFLEIIYLLNVGIASYNVRSHVPSDIPSHNQIIPASNLETQNHLNKIEKWTKNQKMKLNAKKTKSIIFNFSRNHQFTTKLKVDGANLAVVKETKLLGVTITDDLKWNKNTAELVKKGYKRMQLLNAAASFTSARQDLKSIYTTFVRSVLEQSSVVWHSSLSCENRKDLERLQKTAVRIILGKTYNNYKQGLKMLNLQTLNQRRKMLCLKFARKCLMNEKVRTFSPKNTSKHKMKKRKTKPFKQSKINTERYKNSAIPYMRRLLNKDEEIKRSSLKN